MWGNYHQDLLVGKVEIAVLHGDITLRELKLACLANVKGVKFSGPGGEQSADVHSDGICTLKKPFHLGKDQVLSIQK